MTSAGRVESRPDVCRPGGPGPWAVSEVARMLAVEAIALTLVLLGWYRISGRSSVPTQLAWLNLSLAGLVVSGIANGLWLLRGRRYVARARMVAVPGRTGPSPSDRSDVVTGAGLLVTGLSMTHYHRPGCPLVAGKPVVAAGRREHESAGLRACEACQA